MRGAEAIAISAALALTVAGVAMLRRASRLSRNRERQRRLRIERIGRVTDGYASGYSNGLVEYSWAWCGVSYTGSQDIQDLLQLNPELPIRLRGRVHVRLLPNAPHDSIVASENWSGVHRDTGNSV